ncbi:poly-beta-1,6-N-acetyl-D-glucosamine biosynthesis protein PgaD [Dyella tabacisoli]|nr:poly-beta-1,6-N-acetyl-D-glucosamine biosynthesis protein PgaD [Dyella tabacisoli]
MRAEAIVIQRPHRQRPVQRWLFTVITLLAWLAWSSLWLPLLTLIAWSLGAHSSYVEMVVRKHGQGAHDMLTMVLISLISAALALAWSNYNRLRYGRMKRRTGRHVVDRATMARALHVQQATAVQMGLASCIVLDFLDDGTVAHQAGDGGLPKV